jgi:hypothetical protein
MGDTKSGLEGVPDEDGVVGPGATAAAKGLADFPLSAFEGEVFLAAPEGLDPRPFD